MTSTQNSFDATELKLERIARGDPLLNRLVRIKVSPILSGVVYSVVFYWVRAFAAWRAGHLRTVGTVTGFFDQPDLYTNLISGAVVWAYYTWMPKGIVTVFKGLHDNGVIGVPIPTMHRKKGQKRTDISFVEEMRTLFGKWWWSAVSLAIAVGATFILVLPQYLALSQSAATGADTLSLILSLLWMLIGLYCVVLLLVYSMLGIYWLRRLFNSFTIHVRPLHPDRAGGLSPLGNFTLMLSYLIALIGIMLVITPIPRNYLAVGTWRFRWTTELLVGLGIYVVAAPIVFFAPLWVAHNTMEEAKDQLLLQIARRFEKEYSEIQKVLDKDISSLEDRSKILENSSKILRELQALHDTTSKFPVWPFNVSNVTRFGTSYVSPIALAILIDLLGKLITP